MNEQIKEGLPVFAKEAALEDARRINGLRAVFGEVSLLMLTSVFSTVNMLMIH